MLHIESLHGLVSQSLIYSRVQLTNALVACMVSLFVLEHLSGCSVLFWKASIT
jgi:hypothetical protein